MMPLELITRVHTQIYKENREFLMFALLQMSIIYTLVNSLKELPNQCFQEVVLNEICEELIISIHNQYKIIAKSTHKCCTKDFKSKHYL